MLALQGYYDGNMVRTLEKIHAKKNQKLIITVLDEFMDESDSKDEKKFLRKFLKLTGGIPSAKTYERVISLIDCQEFRLHRPPSHQ